MQDRPWLTELRYQGVCCSLLQFTFFSVRNLLDTATLYFKIVSDAAWSDAFVDLCRHLGVQGVAVCWCHAWLCFLIGTVMPLVVFRLSKKNVCCINVVFS